MISPLPDDIPIASTSSTQSASPPTTAHLAHDKYLAPTPRVSQRAPTSCRACYTRKIKCDKVIPCGACIKRGLADTCTREAVIVRGSLVGPPPSIERHPLSQEQVHQLTEAQLRAEVATLRKRVADLEGKGSEGKGKKRKISTGVSESPSLGSAGASSPALVLSASSGEPPYQPPQKDGTGELLFPYLDVMGLPYWKNMRDLHPQDSTGTTVATPPDLVEAKPRDAVSSPAPNDYLSGRRPSALGIQSGFSPLTTRQTDPSPLIDFAPADDSSPLLDTSPPSFSGFATPSVHSLNPSPRLPLNLLTLVPLNISSDLVRKSLTFTNWIHCAVHVPSWIIEHDEWLEGIKREDMQGRPLVGTKGDAWLAVYFAIISSGLYFLDDVLGNAMGLSSDQVASLPQLWFDACLEALHRTNFMSTTPTFEALQVITILPMISHCFGASAYIESLLHLGLRMAQLLGLHLLGPEPEDVPTTPGLIRRELGRRIWLLLLIGEGNPALNVPGALFMPPAVTVEPANVNDEDLSDSGPLVSKPSHIATLVSHMTAAGRRQKIFRHFSEAFYSATSLDDQYTLSMSTDQALLTLLTYFPVLQPTDEPYPEYLDVNEPFDYIPASRFLWAILGPSGRILVYRTFFGRSYKDDRFLEVRQIVLGAAREVLRQSRRPAPAVFKRSWGVGALTILSAVVLATELLHGNCDPATSASLLSDIKVAIESLPSCGPTSQVVIRGMHLLQKVVDSAPAPIDPNAQLPQAQDFAFGTQDFFGEAFGNMPTVEMLWPGISMDGGVQDGAAWTAAENESWLNAVKSMEQLDGELWWNP